MSDSWSNNPDLPPWTDLWDDDWSSRPQGLMKASSDTALNPAPWPATSPSSSTLSQDVKAAVEEIDSIVNELWRTALPQNVACLDNNSGVSSPVFNVCSPIPHIIEPLDEIQSLQPPGDQVLSSNDILRIAIVGVDSIQHSNETVRENKPKHKCDKCDKCYNWLNDLVKHKKVHSGNRHKCSDCNKSYVLKSDLFKHQRVHNLDERFLCKHCGKIFTSKGDMHKHVRIHTGERPYFCEVCKKSFSASDNFRKHMKIHSGDKPLICSDCGQKFLKKSNLQQHCRIHLGEKPFLCQTCGLSFTQKTHLKTHLSTHSGLKPHFCSGCNQRFTRNADLKRHMKRAHADRTENRGL